MRPSHRRCLILGVWTLIAALVLYAVLRRIGHSELATQLGNVALPFLACAIALRFGNFCLFAIRSALLLAPLRRLSFWVLLKSALLVHAVNNLIPLRAGEAARSGYLAKHGGLSASSCLAVIAVERMLDVMAIFIIVVCALPAIGFSLPLGAPSVLVVLAAASIGGAIWISRSPDCFVALCCWLAGFLGARFRHFVGDKASSFAAGMAALKSPLTVAAVSGLTLLYWLSATLVIQLWIWALGLDVPWHASVVVLAFVNFGLAIPSTPGHIGTYHFLAASAMLAVGLGESEAIAFALVGHAMAVGPFTMLSVPLFFQEFKGLSTGEAIPPTGARQASRALARHREKMGVSA